MIREHETCWIVGRIDKTNYKQPAVACGQRDWTAAARDPGVVTCMDCRWIIEEREYFNGR